MARNKKVEILSHDGQVLHPITDGDCVIFPDGETLARKLSEQEEVMYTPEVVNSSPMFKVGEGDTSDYSTSVLDGAYQEAVLKGQTYVNTIQEPSADVITLPTPFTEYERTQSKTFTEMQDGTFGLNLVGQSYVNCIQEPSEPSYVALGENLEFQNKKVEYTTDGQIKSAMLNGQTLVNVFQFTSKSDFSSSEKMILDGTTIILNADGTYQNFWLKNNGLVKANTTYLFIVDILENTLVYKDGMLDTESVLYITSSVSNNNDSNFFPAGVVISKNDLKQNKFIKKLASNPTSTGDELLLTRPFLSPNAISGTIKFKVMIIEYQEGMENWDIPYFEGMQSVAMATELENVCSRYNSSTAKNGKTFTIGSANDRRIILSDSSNIAKYGFKQNMKYLMQFKITNLNLDGEEYIKLIFSDSNVSSGNALFGDYASTTVKITKNGIYRTVLTTSNVIGTSVFIIKGLAEQWEGTSSTSRKLTISQIMCIEYQNGMENWDLPYFETTQLMKPFKVRTMSKNLCPVGKGQFFNCFFKAGTQFTLSTKDGIASNGGNIVFKDKDGNSMWLGIDSGASISRTTLAKDAYQIVNQLNSEVIQYQLEEGSTSTDYVPHQSKITSALEPITLRAIGDVKDTLDLSTGEYIQRIGEIVLDGSDDEGWYYTANTDDAGSERFCVKITGRKYYSNNIIVCDKYRVVVFGNLWNGVEDNCIGAWGGGVDINVRNTQYTSLADFKTSLQNNPIKVQYELANPITRKIPLEYPNLQTYTDITHVQSIAMGGTLIPSIYLPSDISYKAMLKPNTSYNVIVDREVIDSTNQLTVNLGGTTTNITTNRTVVRTPSTLSNETLTFSGKDNRLAKAMLIEGSTLINGDLPHFDGIGDVKLGRVVENLCMANHTTVGGAASTGTLYSDKITSKITKTGSNVHIFQLTKNLENSKRYFIYCPYDYQYTIYGFRHEYNNSLSYTYQSCEGVNKKYAIIRIDGNQQKNPYTHFTVGCHGNIPVNTTMTIRRPIICEYIDGMENWDWESIGYFTGSRNIGNEFMRISNKNLFDLNKDDFVQGSRLIENNLQVSSSNIRITSKNLKTFKCKPNTSYTVTLNNSNYDLGIYVIDNDGNVLYDSGWIGWISQKSNKTFTTNEKAKYFVFHCRKTDNSNITTDDYNYSSIQIEEASSATSYVAHKHNSLHILPNEQIPLTFVQGTISYAQNGTWENAINNTNTNRIRTQLLDLEPNETYRVSCGSSNYGFGCQGYNNDLLGKSDSGWTYDEYYFTTTKDVHRYAINVKNKDGGNITPSVLHQVRLEKVTDVTLRSVGDVKDELDLTRGVYIQRIDEVVLDGINNNKIDPYSIGGDNKHFIQVRLKNKKDGDFANYYNEKIMKDDNGYLNYSNSNPPSNKLMVTGDKNIRFTFSGGNNLDLNTELKMLKKYPITVQYVLETPIEHRINIPMKNESNQTIAKSNGIFTLPLMYSGNNHIDINSQIYPKVQSRDYISYPVIANNSQLHTVFHNKLGTGNLTVNLCGTSVTSVDGTSKCTITTPSTISKYELRLSGARNKVSNVCVFSGDYMNVNVPYVQGMMNAVNPTVKNASLNHANITTSGHTNFYIGRIYKGETYSLKLNRNKNVGYNLVLKYGTSVDGGEEMLKDFIFSDFTTFTSNYNGYLYFNGWETVDVDNIMLCLGTYTEQNIPQYEPYKENICEPHSEDIITLRSLPSGVRDELNLQTGEYIQRIGEVVFDGSSDEVMWFNSGWTNGDSVACYWNVNEMGLPNKNPGIFNVVCHSFPTNIGVFGTSNDIVGEAIWGEKNSNVIYISIKKTKLPELNTNGFRQWASQNPITVQYELATPIVKQVDINNFPHSYKDGHVVIESNDPSTNVTAQMTYRCVTNRSGQIQEHTEQVEKQERQINELETLILENIRLSQNRSQNFLTSLISTLEIEEE